MMWKTVRFCVGALVVLAIAAMPAQAQLVTSDVATGGLTPGDLVDVLLGAGSEAEVSNVSLTGDARCAGVFAGGGTLIGPEMGVLLSSGRIGDAVGPNSADNITTNFGTPGDAFLDAISGGTTFDACILEFDFDCPSTDVVSFEYVFASDEYNEFVGSVFNDAFAFGLNGANIALLPDNVTPVTINNVNNAVNPAFYVDNDCSDGPCPVNIEADGFTVELGAESGINAGANNIRLAIADTGDAAFDSWVFLEGGSFQCQPLCDDFTTVDFDQPMAHPPLDGIFGGIDWGHQEWEVDAFPCGDCDPKLAYFRCSGSHCSAPSCRRFSFVEPSIFNSLSASAHISDGLMDIRSYDENGDLLEELTGINVTRSECGLVETDFSRAATTIEICFEFGWELAVDDIVYCTP